MTVRARFEPQIVPKHQRRFAGFDDKIISMYARGMSTREISKHLEEIYGVEVGRDTISRVTDAVLDDVKEWQARPLEKLYLVVWLDAIVLKIRDQGSVRNKHAYLAIGVGIDGIKETLGIWLEANEGAKFWLRVISELKARGVEDILVFSVDGLKGFPQAIEAVYPQAIVQTCIVHMIRNSLRFTSYKDRKQARQRPADDLHRADRRGRPRRARDVRRHLGQPLPANQPVVAGRLGAGDPLLQLPRRRYAGRCTRPTRSRASTASFAKQSGSAATSPTTSPPASSSTSRSETTRAPGNDPWPAVIHPWVRWRLD